MTDLLSTLSIPEEIRSYLAVLGLLLCWKLHGIEARRKKAVISQFYICLGDARFLDRQYTVFGHTVEGQNVADAIRVGDVMSKVTVEEKPSAA